MNTTACRLHPCTVQRNLSVERVFQFDDINFQRLPLFWRSCQRDSLCIFSVTGFETMCCIPDKTTRDAVATSSNSCSKHDLRPRGDDESIFEHAHAPLEKLDLRLLEQMKQQKTAGEAENTISFRRTCGAEEDGDHEQNRSPTFESLQLDSCRLMYSAKRGSDVRNFQQMVIQLVVFSFREEAGVTR